MNALMAFYPEIKLAHTTAVMTSGSLFALRAAGLLAGMRWPRAAVVRYVSYTVDTALLTAALMLLTMLPAALFANGWLWVKLVLVVMYIGFGIAAFRASRGVPARVALIAAALACFLQAYGIARAHHPLGWLLWLGS